MSETLRKLIAQPIASGLRQRLPSGREDYRTRADSACIGEFDRERLLLTTQRHDAGQRVDRDVAMRKLSDERVENRSRSIGIRKQLPIDFLVQRDPELREEADGLPGRKCAQHLTDDARASRPRNRAR